MTAQNLVAARRMRSEEELREVMTSGSIKRIEATCKRAELAGVSRAFIEAALAVAERLRAVEGQEASDPNTRFTAGLGGTGVETPLTVARRQRAEQELLEASRGLSPKQVEAAIKRAEVAGVERASIEAAREAVRELLAAENQEKAAEAKAQPDLVMAKENGQCQAKAESDSVMAKENGQRQAKAESDPVMAKENGQAESDSVMAKENGQAAKLEPEQLSNCDAELHQNCEAAPEVKSWSTAVVEYVPVIPVISSVAAIFEAAPAPPEVAGNAGA